MGIGSIVILTSLAWGLVFYLIGIPAYRKGYHKGYFNGWHDKTEDKRYDDAVQK